MTHQHAWSGLQDEGRHLVEALGGRWTPAGGLCRCPAHADHSPSLSVRQGRCRLLLHCFAGCTAEDILAALARERLLVPGAAAAAAVSPASAARDLSQAALRVWGAARPIARSPVAAYLGGRAIETDDPGLRYLARTPHGPKPLTQFRRAMIAAVRDNHGLVAVHRSFLDPRQPRLASLAEPRCGLGRFGRGAVRLGGIGRKLGLAEGIETALSVSQLFGLPCWATLGTERFALIELPPGVEALALFLDHDAGGRRAEALARAAFSEDLPIEVHVPDKPGDDWNDVLRARSGCGAPVPAEARERRGGG